MAPANTGNDNNNKIAVIITDHTNNGKFSKDIFLFRIFKIVVMKLMAPRIEDTPAICKEKIVKSTEFPLWNSWFDSGGYTVHPVPAPMSEKEDIIKKDKDGGNNQNLILFMRGNAMSGAPIIIGTNQFPNPPIMMGITIKKIMMKAWAVTITL